MGIDILRKFVDVFGDKADKEFTALKEFKRLGLYKEVK